MPKMICKTALEYPPGSAWKPGDEFEVEEAHFELLKLTGHAEDPPAVEAAQVESAPAKRKYTRQSAA